MNIDNNLFLKKIYKFFFGCMIFSIVLRSSTIIHIIPLSSISSIFKLIIMFISMLIIFYKKVRLDTLISWIFLLVMILFTVYNSKDFNFLLYILLAFSIDKNEVMDYIKIAVISMILGVFFVLLLWGLGIIPDNITMRAGVTRRSLGFSLPVTLPAFYFSISSMIFILGKEKSKGILLFFLLIPGLVIYHVCDGRTSFYGLLLLLSFLLMYRILQFFCSEKQIAVILQFGIYSIGLLGFLLSYYAAVNYDKGNLIIDILDNVLTGRIYWWNKYINSYQIKFFGQEILRISSTARQFDSNALIMILDNSYLSLLIEQGVVLTTLVIYLLKNLIRILASQNNNIVMIVWVIYLILGFFGNSLLYLETNILILQFSILIGEDKHIVNE